MLTLQDLLKNDLRTAWDNTTTADDYQPLASGAYEMEAVSGTIAESKTGKPKYTIKWRVSGGEYAGRCVWQDLWLTAPALPMTKRELGKLGITHIDDIEKPLPTGRIYQVQVVVRVRENGASHNEVKRFDYLRTEIDPFDPSLVEVPIELDPKERIEREIEEGTAQWVKDLQEAAQGEANG